ELGPNEVLALRVVTGVPRGDEIVPHAEPERVESVLPPRYNYPILDGASKGTTKSTAPAPTASAPRKIRVQTEMPSKTSMGRVEEFEYVITGNSLQVSDRSGMPVGSAVVRPGDDYDAAARKVVLFSKREGKNSDFWQRTLN